MLTHGRLEAMCSLANSYVGGEVRETTLVKEVLRELIKEFSNSLCNEALALERHTDDLDRCQENGWNHVPTGEYAEEVMFRMDEMRARQAILQETVNHLNGMCRKQNER